MKKLLFALSIAAAVSFPAFACLGCKCADADKEPAVKQEETVQEKQSFDKCDAPLQMKIAKAQQEGAGDSLLQQPAHLVPAHKAHDTSAAWRAAVRPCCFLLPL